MATEPVVGPGPVSNDDTTVHVVRETLTMGLYLAISLLAVLTALPHRVPSSPGVLGLVWGATVGLVLAHVLAFRVTARLLGGGALGREDRLAIAGQLLSAVVVAGAASLPFLLTGGESALAWSRLVLAGGVGVLVYAIAQRSLGVARSSMYAGSVIVLALLVAAVKNVLAGH